MKNSNLKLMVTLFKMSGQENSNIMMVLEENIVLMQAMMIIFIQSISK